MKNPLKEKDTVYYKIYLVNKGVEAQTFWCFYGKPKAITGSNVYAKLSIAESSIFTCGIKSIFKHTIIFSSIVDFDEIVYFIKLRYKIRVIMSTITHNETITRLFILR